MRVLIGLGCLALLAGGENEESAAWAADAAKPVTHCFSESQFNGWRAADARTIYLRANVNRTYRVELASECSTLMKQGAQLLLSLRGAAVACSAVDIGIKASEPFGGAPEPCFVKSLTELSAMEAASLPPSLKP